MYKYRPLRWDVLGHLASCLCSLSLLPWLPIFVVVVFEADVATELALPVLRAAGEVVVVLLGAHILLLWMKAFLATILF